MNVKCIIYILQQVKSEGAKAVFALTIPPDFPVGSYRVEMEVTPEDSWNTTEFDVPKEFVVLFNPWCKGEEGGERGILCIIISAQR